MRIAHLSDLHINSPEAIKTSHFFTNGLPNRRVFGGLNFLLRRRSIHSVDVLNAAVDAVLASGADHCIITGDLSNLAIDAEFAFVRSILDRIGGPEKLSVVPGNHDYYTPEAVAVRRFERHFGRFAGAGRDGMYPAHKDFPGVRVILAKTAMMPPPGFAWGALGEAQLDSIARLADEAAAQDMFVILAQHHHLHIRAHRMDEITGHFNDRVAELEMLSKSRIGLVIHGHDHLHQDWSIDSHARSGRTRIICCGSSTYLDHARKRLGRMTIFNINDGNLAVEKWKYQPDQEQFVLSAE